mmetsp:Transcript_25904/g.64726  ORF Transcript_25904/g.64726 Transcript_25904/m.64726 type:complete len:232 (+) Transcript_25904:1190-1885(+)
MPFDLLIAHELRSVQPGRVLPPFDDQSEEIEEALLRVQPLPLEIIQAAILAPRVVVAVFRVANLIAHDKHRDASRHEQGNHEVLHLAQPKLVHFTVASSSFFAAVPAFVVIIAVIVVFAVLFVVFPIIRDDVHQGKPIVCDDEIDRMVRLPVFLIQISGPAEPRRKVPLCPLVSLHEPPHAVPIFAVPLSPMAVMRKRADLVEPAAIPRLRDQFHVAHRGVLRHALNHRRI